MDEAYTVIRKRQGNLSKWGPCEALPLVEETPAKWEVTGTHDVTLTLTRATMADPKKVAAAVAKQIGAKAKDINIVSQYPTATTYTYAAQTGEGKAVTRYFVVPAGGSMPKWDDGYASMAEARAAIRDGSAFPSFSRGDIEVEVIAMTRREGGGGMLTGKRTVKTQTIQCRVQTRRLITPAKKGTTQAGWIFYGWGRELTRPGWGSLRR